MSAFIAVLVLIGGGYAVMQGQLTLGELVAFQSLAASFAAPVTGLAGFGAELQQLRQVPAGRRHEQHPPLPVVRTGERGLIEGIELARWHRHTGRHRHDSERT